MNQYTGIGIKEELVENYNEFKKIIGSLVCVICLDIVRNPLQCEKCESLYCEDCWEIMKISGKKCVLHCIAPIRKANTFVRDMLSNLKITCETCGKKSIDYNLYVKHMEACIMNKKITTKEELLKVIKEKEIKVDEIVAEIENLKINGLPTPNGKSKALSVEQIRKNLMTFNLNVNQKMDLYNAAVEGRLNDFKNLILNKKYSIFEEVSAHNYYWTSIHYSMHYGQIEIIMFCLEYLFHHLKCLDMAMKLESDDGRCPLLCLLRSNALNTEMKKVILQKIFSNFPISISKEVRAELRNRDMENLVKKAISNYK